MFVPWIVYLVGEVDEELRVAPDGESLYPQGHFSLQAGYEAFVFCNVVGDLLALLEAELHDVVELVLSGRDEHCSSPRALAREATIEIHDPVIRHLASWREGPVFAYFKRRGVCPFCHEISE